MPGTYAHLAVVNHLREPARLEAIPGFPTAAIPMILDQFRFCELGAVSPDYPYLSVRDKGAAKWADLMHYERTGEMIKVGVRMLRDTNGDAQTKGLAWLLGYSAHVATDVTIHPVVELKVGVYARNKTKHRVCEMNQDTHIFQRLNLGDIGLSEHLKSGIARCGDGQGLDPVVKQLWDKMFEEVHSQEFQVNRPDTGKWHRFFLLMVDKIAEEGNHLLPLARHLAANVAGLTYPSLEDIDQQYITNLAVPSGHMNYDDIFDRAIANVGRVWQLVASGVLNRDDAYSAGIGDWNLDTGRDINSNLVFWGQA